MQSILGTEKSNAFTMYCKSLTLVANRTDLTIRKVRSANSGYTIQDAEMTS
jgi:hypothetical protein